MPRPADGYRNRAGQQVPGVHDITNAYCPKPALVQWAYNQGRKGVPLYEKGTLDIGTAVHAMAELDLKGRPPREIDAKVHELLKEPDHVAKAWLAFNAYTEWRERFGVRSIAHEVTLVSEQFQLGGTPDCIAFVDGRVALLDFKSCTRAPKEPYREQLLVMAAHATLWNEAHPDRRVAECHIVYLPKDGATPAHHAYADLDPQWNEFCHLLTAFQVKNGTPRPADPKDAEIARLQAEIGRAAVAPKRRVSRKRVKAPEIEPVPAPAVIALPPPRQIPMAPMSMTEILRSYGHVKT